MRRNDQTHKNPVLVIEVKGKPDKELSSLVVGPLCGALNKSTNTLTDHAPSNENDSYAVITVAIPLPEYVEIENIPDYCRNLLQQHGNENNESNNLLHLVSDKSGE